MSSFFSGPRICVLVNKEIHKKKETYGNQELEILQFLAWFLYEGYLYINHSNRNRCPFVTPEASPLFIHIFDSQIDLAGCCFQPI